MALTKYINLHWKMHFLAMYSMQNFDIFCPPGPTMVCIQVKLQLVKYYWNFLQYNFKKLIQTLTSEVDWR